MIEFKHVSKNYEESEAIRDFSLKIPAHKITVLMGLSGSGKTTLIRMINKMVEPTSGEVQLDGKNVASLNGVTLRRSIGYVMQEVGLLPHKSILENVTLIAEISGQSKTTAFKNATEMLELVGISESLYNRRPAQLSGGQQQRVGVARALAVKPNILLMDEPFGAVDPIVREELQDELEKIQRRLRLTIVFITHDRHEALRLSDQLVVLSDKGKIEQLGSPEEVTKNPKNNFVKKLLGL